MRNTHINFCKFDNSTSLRKCFICGESLPAHETYSAFVRHKGMASTVNICDNCRNSPQTPSIEEKIITLWEIRHML